MNRSELKKRIQELEQQLDELMLIDSAGAEVKSTSTKTATTVDTPEIYIKGPKGTVTSADHSGLFNLDYEHSGHTRFAGIEFGTTAQWDAKRDYRPVQGMIVVYTDYIKKDDGAGNITYLPGFKLGDGNAYLIDKPFLGEDVRRALRDHLDNLVVHITQEERERWNDKLNYIEPDGNDLLEFTRD